MAKQNGTARVGDKRQREFHLPSGCSVGSFVMRELDGNDDLDIAVWIEAASTSAIEENPIALMKFERVEALRCSLVSVDGEPVNVDGKPYKGMDKWSRRTMQFVGTAFNELNGAEADELKKFRAGEFGPTNPAKSEGPAVRTGVPSAA